MRHFSQFRAELFSGDGAISIYVNDRGELEDWLKQDFLFYILGSYIIFGDWFSVEQMTLKWNIV